MSDFQQGPDWWLATDGRWYPPAQPTPPPRKRPARWWLLLIPVVLIGAGVAVALTMRNSTKVSDEKVTIIGSLHLSTASLFKRSNQCQGIGGFDDITESTQVTATDDKGTVLGVTHLGQGTLDTSTNCSFAFTMTLPRAAFYSFEVSHRGALTYSYDDLKAKGFLVAFTLG